MNFQRLFIPIHDSRFYFLLFCLVLFMTPFSSFAQISGTFTIGSGGNYATFTAAAADLNSVGVDGPVTFNVLSGTYTEQFEISRDPVLLIPSSFNHKAEIMRMWKFNLQRMQL